MKDPDGLTAFFYGRVAEAPSPYEEIYNAVEAAYVIEFGKPLDDEDEIARVEAIVHHMHSNKVEIDDRFKPRIIRGSEDIGFIGRLQ